MRKPINNALLSINLLQKLKINKFAERIQPTVLEHLQTSKSYVRIVVASRYVDV